MAAATASHRGIWPHVSTTIPLQFIINNNPGDSVSLSLSDKKARSCAPAQCKFSTKGLLVCCEILHSESDKRLVTRYEDPGAIRLCQPIDSTDHDLQEFSEDASLSRKKEGNQYQESQLNDHS